MEFTHFDDLGNARMVDVSDKSVTGRSAYAVGTIRMNREAFSAITGGKVRKGDVLTVAQVAGIMGIRVNVAATDPKFTNLDKSNKTLFIQPHTYANNGALNTNITIGTAALNNGTSNKITLYIAILANSSGGFDLEVFTSSYQSSTSNLIKLTGNVTVYYLE